MSDWPSMRIMAIADVLELDSCDSGWWAGDYDSVGEFLRSSCVWEDHNYEHVVQSIRERGFTKPVRVNFRDSRLQDGHHRVQAAIDLGYNFVPVMEAYGPDSDSGYWRMFDYWTQEER